MTIRRMRVFAGPNGSGKTTIINNLKSQINLGVYVNADDIEYSLTHHNIIDFSSYKVEIDSYQIQAFFKASKLSPVMHKNALFYKNITVENNQLVLNPELPIDAYVAADIAELIRQKLLAARISFTFETVMSHPAKIDFLINAKQNGFRIYLYYIATEDPSININRVNVRVAQNGHLVSPDVIEKRYYKSLQNLKQAVKQTNRAYIFDNSGNASLLIAEITNGIDVKMIDPQKAPNWFIKYLVD